jgi:hypothetical protein
MQNYAAELATAVGAATGTGVVHGFDPVVTTIDGKVFVDVPGGLAIDPRGRPLQATGTARIPFTSAEQPGDANSFWVVEIARTTAEFGTEPVYGNPCAEPCSGSALTPWLAEGVKARLRLEKLSTSGRPEERRSRIASQYFESERERSDPWLVPATQDTADEPLLPIGRRPWTSVAKAPSKAASDSWVPLAVVWLDDEKLQLDLWTARREIYGRRAEGLWRTRLAMRPWSVFLAQILQFQDHLRHLPAGWDAPQEVEAFAEFWAPVATFVKAMADTPVKNWSDYKEFMAALEKSGGTRAAALTEGRSLRAAGLLELPPAGLLPMPQGDNAQAVISGWFEGVKVRFVDCRADHVPGALERARDLDRIPLGSGSPKPYVDVLIPRLEADIPPLQIEPVKYGGVAFVRNDEVQTVVDPPPVDTVEVDYVNDSALDDTIGAYSGGNRPGTRIRPDLTYPKAGWQYPGGETAGAVPLTDLPVEVIAVASTVARAPLATLRAALFCASLRQPGVNSFPLDQVHTVVPVNPPEGGQPEVIVILQVPAS